jgi:cytochrome P450
MLSVQIVAKAGVTLPNGTTLPQGTQTLIPMEPIHLDEAIYPRASVYNAFRFCEPGFTSSIFDGPQAPDSKATNPQNSDSPTSKSRPSTGEERIKSTVTLDDAFVSFGIGKYACPGRFFALYEMKLMLAHIVTNYDINFLEERPVPLNLMWLKLPSAKVKISVRKLGNIH